MNRLKWSLSSVWKLLCTRRVNFFMAWLVLTASAFCGLFVTAMGCANAREAQKNAYQSRSLSFSLENAAPQSVLEAMQAVAKNYPLDSCVVFSEAKREQSVYNGIGTAAVQDTVCIATEYTSGGEHLLSRDAFLAGANLNRGEVLLAGDVSFNPNDPPLFTINYKPFSAVGAGAHRYYSSYNLSLSCAELWMSRADFLETAKTVDEVCFMLREAPNEAALETILQSISSYITPTQLRYTPPEQGLQVEKSKLLVSFLLLFVSFVNVQTIFHFLCAKRKKEFRIYRIYGAKRAYIFWDIFLMIFLVSLLSFGSAVLLYAVIQPFAAPYQLNYPLNTFTVLFVCGALLVLDVFSALRCLKDVMRYENR